MPDGMGGGGEGAGGGSEGMGGLGGYDGGNRDTGLSSADRAVLNNDVGYGDFGYGNFGYENGNSDAGLIPTDRVVNGDWYSGLSNVAATKPGESQMASDAAASYAAQITPEQAKQFAATLGVPESYNFNDPGVKEALYRGMLTAQNQAPGILKSLAEGAIARTPLGLAYNVTKAVGNLASGEATPGGMITNLAMSMAASKLGVSTSTLSAALAGNLGGVAKSAALGAVSKEVSQQSGLPPALTNYGLNATGLNSAIGNTVSGAVNSVLPNTSTGLTKSNIAGAIDRGIGATPAGPGSLNAMDTFNPSQDVLMGTPTPSGPTQSPTVPLEDTTVKPPTLLGTPMAANSANAPAGGLIKLGRTGGDSGPYRESLDQYALAPTQHKWALNQSMTSSDAQKLLDMLDQNAPVFAKEGGSIQHFAGGSQGGVYGSSLDIASMYTDPAEKDAMNTLQKMSDQGDIKTPEGMKTRGGLLALGQSGAPSQQRAVQQMGVIPQLAALLQARGMHLPMRMAEGGTPDHEHPHYDGTPLFRTGGLESLGGKYVEGKGDGTSDDIAAMLANGEYVFSADVVSALGNGSNKAGAKELDHMVQAIRARARSAPPDKLPPDAKPPLEYLKSSKGKTHG